MATVTPNGLDSATTITPQEDREPTFLPDDSDTPIVPPSQNVAHVRAQKAEIGFGEELNQSLAGLEASIAAGNEQVIRERAASNLAYQRITGINQKLIDARNQKGGPLSPEETLKLVDPFNPLNGAANPNEVIERSYASKFISMANTASSYINSNIIDDNTRENPKQQKDAEENFIGLKTQMELYRTFKENNQAEMSKMGYLDYGWKLAKSLFQPYWETEMRGLTPKAGYFSGGLLGSQMRAEADEIAAMPLQQQIENLARIKKGMNPILFDRFMDYMLGESISSERLDNVFTILAPQDLAVGTKMTVNLAKRIAINNAANRAFRQTLEKAAAMDVDKTIPVRAAVQEAMGDVKGAAATRAINTVDQISKGALEPVQTIKDDFPSFFRLDGDQLGDMPGSLSRQHFMDIKESFYQKGSDLFNTLLDVLRVRRNPNIEAMAASEAWLKVMRGKFPGIDLLDIGNPSKASITGELTNTYHVPFYYGDADGRLFGDETTAAAYAQKKGWGDARIIPAEGTVTRTPSELKGTATDLKTKSRLEKNIPETERFLRDIYYRLSKKFVGPLAPGQVQELRDTAESVEGILKRYKETLEKLNKKIITTEPIVEQHGFGYKIAVIRPFKETDDIVREYHLHTPESVSPKTNIINSLGAGFLNKLRTSEDTLAYNESLNRKIAAYTNNALKKWAESEVAAIDEIANRTKWYTPWTWHRRYTNREMYTQWKQMVDQARFEKDPKTGDQGYFWKTIPELDDAYQRMFKRNVTYPEANAYFAHVKLVEGNRVLSEIAEFRNRARLGAEQHRIFLIDPKTGEQLSSQFFDGVQEHKFPGGKGQLLVMGIHPGEESKYWLGANDIPGRTIKKLREGIDKGALKVIRIYAPREFPLENFVESGNNYIQYVITANSESKPLGFNHINRRGGGHFEYDATHFIKQAEIISEAGHDGNIFRRLYTGDKTFMAGSGIKTQDQDVAKKMTQMNGLMKAGKLTEAQELSKQLGIPWDKMQEWYDPNRTVAGKKVGAFIDWDEPFYVVARNKRIYDIDKTLEDRVNAGQKDLFQDASRSGSLADQFRVEYSQPRDAEQLFTLKDEGTQGNPLYKFIHAPLVDPIPTMARALTRAIRSTFMDDYKIYAVEHWLAEAAPYLKAEPTEIKSAPFYHFNNADASGAWKSAPENKIIIDNLLANRWKIQQFIGMPNQVETSIQRMTQYLADQFYNKYGPEENRNVLQKAVTIVPLWMLSKWRDPVSGIRSLAFNAKLGVFAIPQFLVQAQTFANIWALGGRAGANGTFGAMLHQWSRINKSDAFMQAYDDLYSRLNMFGNKPKPGEFIEANRELAKTSFEHIGSEYALTGDAMQGKFFKGVFGNFLDAGQIFFREGEKFTRLGAYYTAFREFRHEFPLKVLTDADRAAILQKADLYVANMSRASASAINSGLLSLPMQFLNYQVRMGELFWSKRISGMDKARMLGVYAAMYGAPGALGVTGFPFMDSIREGALNGGYGLPPYVPGTNQFNDVLMNGVISWAMAHITGIPKGYEHGQQYDVQDRWGTQGLTTIREAMLSDNTIWKILGGAGLDVFGSTLATLDPFWTFARQLLSPDEEGNYFKLTPAHFLGLFKELSGPDLVNRGIYAMHTGRWLDKNGQYIEDVAPTDVLIREITGWKSQDQTDIFRLREIKTAEEAVWKSEGRKIAQEYQRGIDATGDKDYDTAAQLFTNARARMVWAGIPEDMRTQILSQATRGFEPKIMSSQWNWATKNVPAGQEVQRIMAQQERARLTQERNQ